MSNKPPIYVEQAAAARRAAEKLEAEALVWKLAAAAANDNANGAEDVEQNTRDRAVAALDDAMNRLWQARTDR